MRERAIPPPAEGPVDESRTVAVVRPTASQPVLAWRRLRRDRFAITGLLVVVLAILSAIFAAQLAPHDPYRVSSTTRLLPPGSPNYVLGTDDIGRDILSCLLWGDGLELTRFRWTPHC